MDTIIRPFIDRSWGGSGLALYAQWPTIARCASFADRGGDIMRTGGILLLMTGALLSGCQQAPEAAGPRSQGRFAGIGVFDAGKMWSQMTGSGQSEDATAAKIVDDEHIIVVLDSHTGEVRQCGDHSGYCVKMNPWTGPQAALPVKLAKHASDLLSDDQAEAVNANGAK